MVNLEVDKIYTLLAAKELPPYNALKHSALDMCLIKEFTFYLHCFSKALCGVYDDNWILGKFIWKCRNLFFTSCFQI